MTLASERQELILAAVRERGTVRLADLVTRLGVTAVTVRRDVTILADRGLVQRVHGGVTQPHRGHPPEQRALGASSPFGRLPGQPLVGMVVPTVEFYWPPVIQGAQSAWPPQAEGWRSAVPPTTPRRTGARSPRSSTAGHVPC